LGAAGVRALAVYKSSTQFVFAPQFLILLTSSKPADILPRTRDPEGGLHRNWASGQRYQPDTGQKPTFRLLGSHVEQALYRGGLP
jgi:hypothetical protein